MDYGQNNQTGVFNDDVSSGLTPGVGDTPVYENAELTASLADDPKDATISWGLPLPNQDYRNIGSMARVSMDQPHTQGADTLGQIVTLDAAMPPDMADGSANSNSKQEDTSTEKTTIEQHSFISDNHLTVEGMQKLEQLNRKLDETSDISNFYEEIINARQDISQTTDGEAV